MAFTKITNTELNSRGATTLPNQPTISAAALKQEFDAPAKEIVAPHFNGLIDELEADTAGASIGLQAPSRRTGSTVKAVVDAISQDLVTVEGKLNGVTNAGLLDAISLKHEHENKALLDTYDQTNEDIEDAVNQKHSHSNKSVLDKWSESAGGAPLYNGQAMSGDMYSSEYDPDSTVKNAGGIETYVTTELGTKVDKVEGKGLSTNDFTDALKTKLDNIEAGAEVNVQSDWNQSDNSADDYIKNKPTLGTSAYKNSTSVVTQSTDLVESGAVYDVVKGSVGFVTTGKNLLPNNATSQTVNGLTFTVNADKSVTVNGTATANTTLNLVTNFKALEGVTYKISDTVDGGVMGDSGTTYRILVNSLAGAFPVGNRLSTETANVERTALATEDNIVVYIQVFSGVTMNNVTFYPMIKLASVTATAYEPYHASVDETKADNSVIGTVEDGVNPTKAYVVGEHFIRNGKFCTVTVAVTTSSTWVEGSNYTSGDVAECLNLSNLHIILSTATNNREIIEQLFANIIPLLKNDMDSCCGVVKQGGVNTLGFNCFRNTSTTYYAYLYSNDRIFNALYSNGTVTIYQNVGTILN